ncbi:MULTISPECIES: ankyrin repeat domain-containing protein [unclassified Shewanella]|uniref:ankyrin repeat domain-containing protein n=1 Tax=unclassified Shewanella TaxID=196818 RepID=UPI0021D967ED|nr:MULTISPECIES: ankyrin repeat domain-containing protein [unclassified Shewanella]MCU8002992.1 ankyrin repeat domain-containing protein [Shewanella sp. SM96]MCU8063155.1 ankyrin repeat domain-containing protein [Shewanella sp. SM55]MCU8072070.1 ankyrin repeat domain-containing protein [Shewanella sp. SM32]
MKHTIAILLLIIVALSMSVAMGAGSLQAPLVTSATASQTDEPDTAQVQLLVDYFFAAARTGDITVLEHFLDAGFPIDQRNSQTYTALMVAAYNGQEAATDLLLEHGANACLQDKRGNTAMMGAVIKAEFNIVKRLYAKECDASLTNNAGMTLTEFARYWGQSGALQQASLKQ